MIDYSNDRAFDSGSSHTALTLSQRLAAIERSQALRRGRVKATLKVLGVALLVFASCVLVTLRQGEFVLGAALFGIITSTVAIWSGAFDNSNRSLESSSNANIDPRFLKDLDQRLAKLESLDQRLANLETIASYEEKAVARNRQIESAQE